MAKKYVVSPKAMAAGSGPQDLKKLEGGLPVVKERIYHISQLKRIWCVTRHCRMTHEKIFEDIKEGYRVKAFYTEHWERKFECTAALLRSLLTNYLKKKVTQMSAQEAELLLQKFIREGKELT